MKVQSFDLILLFLGKISSRCTQFDLIKIGIGNQDIVYITRSHFQNRSQSIRS